MSSSPAASNGPSPSAPPPNWAARTWQWLRERIAPLSVGIAVSAVVISLGFAGYKYLTPHPRLHLVGGGAPRAAQTEAKFLDQDHVKNSAADSSIIPEWRAARGDHKIIAYTIANCQKVRDQFGGIDTMPRGVFTSLLLDLTPLGDHKFSSEQFASEASAADDGIDQETAVADAGATPSSVVPPIIKRDKSIELT